MVTLVFLWCSCFSLTPAWLDQCSQFLPGWCWCGTHFNSKLQQWTPPPPDVFHLLNPTGDSNHHLIPRAPLTQPSNHLVYTDPTFHAPLYLVGPISFKHKEMDGGVVVIISGNRRNIWTLAVFRKKVYSFSRIHVLPQVTNLTLPWSCCIFPSASNMSESWLLHTHAHHLGAEASSCGCCKTNGRECEHGLCLALMANQVCLMSHCCDYQHGALAQLEAPQVNQRGEANICTAGGPQTTLMGFHLLLGHWTFRKALCPWYSWSVRESQRWSRVKLGTLGTQVLCLSWHVIHHVFHFEPEFPIQYVHSWSVWIYVCLSFFLHMGTGVYAYMSA